MTSILKHSLDGRLYVVRPRPGEDPHAWRARHLSFCAVPSIVLQPGALDERFMLLDDLPPGYRDVLEE
jgi:hypothetical protein